MQLFDNNEVFDDDYAYFYKNYYTKSRNIDETNFIKKIMDIQIDDSILDVQCGYGRITLEFASMGYEITGLDLNESYIEEASLYKYDNNLEAEFYNCDVRDFQINEKKFDKAYLWHNSFGYFEDYENDKLLMDLHDRLTDGGKLLIDQTNPFKILRNLLDNGKLWTDAIYLNEEIMIDRNSFNVLNNRVETNRLVFRNQSFRTSFYSTRLYFPREFEINLKKAGFKDIKFLDEYRNEFNFNSKRLFIIAERG